MPNNLGEISRLKDGLNGLYQITEAYKKIFDTTGIPNPALNSILEYIEENKNILNNLEKKFDTL